MPIGAKWGIGGNVPPRRPTDRCRFAGATQHPLARLDISIDQLALPLGNHVIERHQRPQPLAHRHARMLGVNMLGDLADWRLIRRETTVNYGMRDISDFFSNVRPASVSSPFVLPFIIVPGGIV